MLHRRPRDRSCRPLRPGGGPHPLARPDRAVEAAALGRAFAASPTATIVTDERLHIVAANRAYERLTGLGRPEWIGTLPRLHGPHGEAMAVRVLPAGRESGHAREVMLRHRDGGQRRVWMTWARVDGAPGAGCLHVATFFEFESRDDEIDHWRHRARHDALTGLANREHFAAEIERAVARAARHAHRVALLFIDLDGFKAVNDQLGHAAGDRVLARVGTCLRRALRAEDFVARFGGDEFVVLLEAPRDARDAAAAAEAVLAALADDGIASADPPVTASIGIALYPDTAGDAAGLLQAADAAMYRSKRAGGNVYAVGDAAPAEPRRAREVA